MRWIFNSPVPEPFPFSYFSYTCALVQPCDTRYKLVFIKLELMVMISNEEVFTDIITRNRKNGFHFISKGKMDFKKPFGTGELIKCIRN